MNPRFGPFVILFAVVLWAAAVVRLDGRKGEDLLIQRRYEEAAAALAAALTDEQAGPRDRLLLLLGEARLLAGKPDTAASALEQMLREMPDSELAPAARFLLAKTHERRSDLRAAALVYRGEVERLIGPARKQRVAQVYLDLAQKAQTQDPPDLPRVVAMCDLAVDLGLLPELAARVRLRAARAQLLHGQHQDAAQRLLPLVRDLPPDDGGREAMLLLGRARRLLGDAAGARTALRDLMAQHPSSDEAADAAYEVALSFGVPAPSSAQLDRAVAALLALAADHPNHPQAALAQFYVAQCYAHNGRSDDALRALTQLFVDRPALEGDEAAMARAMRGDVLSGQGKVEEAIAAYREHLSRHPSHREWERVQRAIIDSEWRLCTMAHRAGEEQFELARTRLEEFMAAHPLDARNAQAQLLLGDMLLQQERYEEARAAFARCVQKHPGRDESSRAQYEIGRILEAKTFDFEQALQAYKALTWGPMAGAARERIAALQERSLTVRTTRVFRTDEVPAFELSSRNIESVRVRVFRLDMEDYFRATHRAGSVHELDLEVIAADETFDSAVVGYQPYRLTERPVELPMRGPGAYVIKVDDKKREATTLVLVSDLALIAKSSRHEALVLAQNTKEGRVEAGVKIVLSDGSKVVAEGVTDAAGMWRHRGPLLKSLDQLAVFAVAGNGSGASTFDLSGMGYSTGLLPQGHLMTDRPAYQPGQSMQCKAIVREVEGGVYRLPRSVGYVAAVIAPSGRVVRQEPVAWTEFGSFAFGLDLPAEAEIGQWQCLVRNAELQTAYQTEFQVARYERPRLQLSFELAAATVCRGEPIEGRAVARWFYGEPAGDREVVCALRLPDGAVIERKGRTNSVGEFEFTFPTQDFGEQGLAQVTAELAGEAVRNSVAVPVVTSETAPSVSTRRGVYLAGEPIEAAIELLDMSGAPLQRDCELTVLRLALDPKTRVVAEVEIERQSLKTSADGKAKAVVRDEQGGTLVLRAKTKDRFGVTCTGECRVRVSGPDDEMRVRLLLDQTSWKVGETAPLRVMNRAGKRLALLTWQGDGILKAETRELPEGESRLDLMLAEEHAPNFAFAVTMIDGQKLHAAEIDLLVHRELQVEIAAPATQEPGAAFEVEVKVKDLQGRPVEAEVALAMVDEALLALYPDRTTELRQAFFGRLRETAFRTQSSCAFAYEGHAQEVNAALAAQEAKERIRKLKADPRADGPAREGAGFAAGAEDRQSAFDSNQWNSAVGLGGGSGGRFGGARRGNVQMLAGRVATLTAGQEAGAFFADGGPEDFFSYFQVAGAQAQRARSRFGETGAFFPALRTGKDGSVRVEVTAPDSTTRWRILGMCVTKDTWVGQAQAQMRTQKGLQVEIHGPAALVEGDRTTVSVRVHNMAQEPRQGSVRLLRRSGEKVVEERRELQLGKGEEKSLFFALEAAAPGSVELEARADLGGAQDAVVKNVVVQPFGSEVLAAQSGLAKDRVAVELSLPAGAASSLQRLFIELGKDPSRDLVRAALDEGYVTRNCVQGAGTSLARSSRGLACLAALAHLEQTEGLEGSDRERLQDRVHASIQSLILTQGDDGGFRWIGKGASDVRSTSQAVRLLAACVQRGMAVAQDPLNRAAERLLQAARSADGDLRADLLFALAAASRVRFEQLNAAHRARSQNGALGLAMLAHAWRLFGRPELAAEVVATARQAVPIAGASGLETRAAALLARALLMDDARDALGRALLAAVKQARVGAGWATPEATAAAVELLAFERQTERGEPRATRVAVQVNGVEVMAAQALARAGATLEAPSSALRATGNEVVLLVGGGGEVFWSATLLGWKSGFADEDRREQPLAVNRTYTAAPIRHDGKELSFGFSSVQGSEVRGAENLVTQLMVGESLRVRTMWGRRQRMSPAPDAPWIHEEPIPAGCSVPRESIAGNFDHVEVQPDRLVFFYRDGIDSGAVFYTLQARFAGAYRALPTMVYAATRPSLRAMGPVSALKIHKRGEGERDLYRLSPDERLAIARAEFEAMQAAAPAERAAHADAAQEQLSALLAEWSKPEARLTDAAAAELARMMLFLGIERGDQRQVVRFFEELKDRQPDLVIPFDKILAVGKGYLDLGEFEAALLVFRGTAEASFLKDAAVATSLQSLGEGKAATQFLEKLLQEHPDLSTMRTARYSIAQQLAAQAAEQSGRNEVDERLGSAEELRRRALRQLREFLALYPEDPLAEEVSFAWATTLLEARDLAGALAVAEAAIARYPDSAFVDELLYTVGVAQFALSQHDAAFAALARVAAEQFPNGNGGMQPSENRHHAVYLQGQICHARGEPEKALAAYGKVEDRFTDAGEAIDYFRHKELALPEVASFGLEEDASIELQHRNLERVQIQVYRVDLMRLYLMERSLNDIRGILLHGIRPLQSFEIELGDGRDYKNRSRKVPLELKRPGAYLCVASGDGCFATGMALKTGLRIEAQEQFDTGRMRINLKRGEACVSGAEVKLIGSGGGDFVGGETDLRGVFAGDGLVGMATAIVQSGDEYAFYRGTSPHQPARYRPAAPPSAPAPAPGADKSGARKNARDFDAFGNNIQFNNDNRGQQLRWLQEEVMNKKQAGVEVYRAK